MSEMQIPEKQGDGNVGKLKERNDAKAIENHNPEQQTSTLVILH